MKALQDEQERDALREQVAELYRAADELFWAVKAAPEMTDRQRAALPRLSVALEAAENTINR